MTVTAQREESRRPMHPPGDAPVRILVVDDEPEIRQAIARVLRNAGMLALTASSGADALEILKKEAIDVALIDIRMPAMTGTELLTLMKRNRYPAEVIMMTASADLALTVTVVNDGAYALMTKPFVANDSIVIEVLNAAGHKRLREESERRESELADLRPGEMIGMCAPMREVNRTVAGVAKAESTVLVLGESGTGKELVARAIHRRSRRAHKPLVTVNCAAIPYDLVESELFGHTRGAFTSAVSARAGLFEAANGGTLFLDEIGDLPIGAQVKLLRTLESGEVKPVGSDTVKHVDVRLIAATNANLKAAIMAGTFRQDLFYRLNVIALKLPALRERGDDVLHLAQHFVRKYAEIAHRPTPRLSAEATACLLRYKWPGNVRELEHAIERALVLDDGEVISASSLPSEIGGGLAALATLPPPSVTPASATIAGTVRTLHLHELAFADAKKRVIAEFTDAYVGQLLKLTSGNVSEAARRSGLDRSNFRRLLKKP